MDNGEVLRELIEQDYPLRGFGKYLKAADGEPSSLVVNMEDGIFHWNSRDIAGDALVWLTKVKRIPFNQAKEILKSKSGFKQTYSYTLGDGTEITVLPRLVEEFWQLGKSRREYWHKRGIKDSTIDRFQLGFFNNWYLIPIFLDGTFRNFQMRKDEPKSIKNWYSGVGPLLYNSDILKLTNSVVMTEGPTSAIRLVQEGYPGMSHNGGATGWKPEWARKFENQKKVYYIQDADTAGWQGAVKVAKSLGEYRTFVVDWKAFQEDYGLEAELPKGYDALDFFQSPEFHAAENFNILLEKYTRRVFEIL